MTNDPIEDELDAAMAHLGSDYSFSRVVLAGLAIRRPELVDRLSALTEIAADRLSAATAGAAELTDDEIEWIAAAANLSPLELAWATTGSDESELGKLAARVVESDAKLFRARRGKATRDSMTGTARRVS